MTPRAVAEISSERDVPLWIHPEWHANFPWLAQGTTGRGADEAPFDLGLSGTQPVGAALGRWRRLRDALGLRGVAVSRQVHGAEIWPHQGEPAPGILLLDGYDGHVTDVPGLLLAVGVADCVPVFIADPGRRAISLVHAGWRGTAAGIVERAVALLAARYGSRAEALWLHCGPAICGQCYEVGPEVHAAVAPERPVPARPTPIDLRANIAARAAALGIDAARVSVSAHCTRCGPGAFFSHRGGSPERQMALLGIRPGAP